MKSPGSEDNATVVEALPVPGAARRTQVGLALRAHWPLVLVGVLTFSILTAYTQVQRLDYGPDEPNQLEYLHVLSLKGRLPTPEETYLVQHGPVYYLLLALPYRLTAPHLEPKFYPSGSDERGMFTPRDRSVRRLLRTLQTLLGMAVLVVVYVALRRLTPRQPWAVLAPLAMVGLNPVFGMVMSVCNNEGLAYLWSAVTCLLLVTRLRSDTPPTRGWVVKLGAWIGAGAVVKATTLFIVPVALAAVYHQSRDWRRGLKGVGLLLVAMAATGCWWPLANYQRTGNAFPNYCGNPDTQKIVIAKVLTTPFGEGGSVLTGFTRMIVLTAVTPQWSWSRDGFTREEWVRWSVIVALLLLGAAYMLPGTGGRQADPRPLTVSAPVAGFSLAAMVFAWLAILSQAVLSDHTISVGGRYLLNALPWLAVFSMGAQERVARCLGGRPSPRRVAVCLAFTALTGFAVWHLVHVGLWYREYS